jgi:DGQHR domain-containing protein
MVKKRQIRLPALEVRQNSKWTLYTFAVDGKILPSFAAISRIRRDDQARIEGYQRPEVVSHIRAIQNYLESDHPVIPNSLVIALDDSVQFEPASDGHEPSGYSRPGTLVIPIDETWRDDEKPGWIVDGQQRTAAIRQARIKKFPICVTAFITKDEVEQRTQFILVNSTKPLPKGLIYELLPVTDGELPDILRSRRFPAKLLERLNFDQDSPLRQMIKTPTTPEGLIKDNSLLKMLENSLTDGALYRFREAATGEGDAETMLSLLKDFWRAVSEVWPEAWGLPPRRSRLLHGVGIVNLGFLMDAITDRLWNKERPTQEQFAEDLRNLKAICRWTSGYWVLGPQQQRRWNELQNTPRDIQLLANLLLAEYKARVWAAHPSQRD